MIPLKLDLNERSETPPNWAVKALAECPMDALWRYQDRADLECLLAEKFGLGPADVLLTNGGDEAIQYLFASLAPQTPVILPLPIFGFYREQATLWPVKPVYLPAQSDFSIDVPAILQAISDQSGCLCIITRPNNPTGEVLSRQAMEDLLEACRETESTLLLDEAYAEFFGDPLESLLASNPQLIILRTFSKAFGLAGLRLGYLLNAGGRLEPLRQRALPYNIAAPSLWIGAQALEPAALEEVTQYAKTVATNRDKLLDQLRDLGIDAYPGQANFVFLNLGNLRAEWAFAGLKQLGVQVRRFSQEDLQGCLRIAVPADAQSLEQALLKVFKPNLICLDVDGTLLDTRQSFDALVVKLVEEFSGKRPSDEEILAIRAKGGFNDDFALAAELSRRNGSSVDYETVAQAGTKLYFGEKDQPGLHQLETPIYRKGLLTWLASQSRLALVTGRSQAELGLAEDLLEELGDVPCITIDTVNQGKPHPEGIYKAAAMTRCQRLWMVGDNPDDIVAARSAGALAIGVGPNRDALQAAGATLVFDNINQIEGLL